MFKQIWCCATKIWFVNSRIFGVANKNASTNELAETYSVATIECEWERQNKRVHAERERNTHREKCHLWIISSKIPILLASMSKNKSDMHCDQQQVD